jgi:hypothetical protein
MSIWNKWMNDTLGHGKKNLSIQGKEVTLVLIFL